MENGCIIRAFFKTDTDTGTDIDDLNSDSKDTNHKQISLAFIMRGYL